MNYTIAVIENEDGTVSEVLPCNLKFNNEIAYGYLNSIKVTYNTDQSAEDILLNAYQGPRWLHRLGWRLYTPATCVHAMHVFAGQLVKRAEREIRAGMPNKKSSQ